MLGQMSPWTLRDKGIRQVSTTNPGSPGHSRKVWPGETFGVTSESGRCESHRQKGCRWGAGWGPEAKATGRLRQRCGSWAPLSISTGATSMGWWRGRAALGCRVGEAAALPPGRGQLAPPGKGCRTVSESTCPPQTSSVSSGVKYPDSWFICILNPKGAGLPFHLHHPPSALGPFWP